MDGPSDAPLAIATLSMLDLPSRLLQRIQRFILPLLPHRYVVGIVRREGHQRDLGFFQDARKLPKHACT
jgi:hypothetical protein